MNDISELERRILYALERIDVATAQIGRGSVAAPVPLKPSWPAQPSMWMR
jgi:hypothetical protein